MTGGSVGIDVGGSVIKAVRRTSEGVIAARASAPTPDTGDRLIDRVADLVESMGPGLPVGIGVAGLVDRSHGILTWGPHLPGSGVPVGPELSRRLGVDVVVDNDADLAAVGEFADGAGRGRPGGVVISIGTGIGMGTMVEGKILRGRGHAGEVGHVTVEVPGDECPCGRRGCWETKVSGRILDEAARSLLGPAATASDLTAAARRGEAAAVDVMAIAAAWLALGVESIVLVLDPPVVIVGGGVGVDAADLLLPAVVDRLAGTEGARHRQPTPVVSGTLGPEAGAVGAAIAAIGNIAAIGDPRMT